MLDEIDTLLKEREKRYPIRDEVYTQLNDKLSKFANSILSDLATTTEWEPDKRLIDKANRVIQRPVFICGRMKAGTTLLTQLLDGHQNILALPGDSRFIARFSQPVNFNDLLTYWIKRLVNPSGKSPFWFLGKEYKAYLQFARYLQHFYYRKPPTPFHAVVKSLIALLMKNNDAIFFWVEKTTRNEEHIEEILHFFPKARFIHVLRDPLVNIASLKRWSSYRNRHFNAYNEAKYLLRSYNLSAKNTSLYREKYYVVRFEDLLSNPAHIMHQIADFLGIDFLQVLLVPTENGKKAKANSMYKEGRVVGKLAPGAINQNWLNELTRKEKQEAISVLYQSALKAGYSHWKEPVIKQHRKIIVLSINRMKYLFSRLKSKL